jgi:UDP-N-acetylmuramyl pentapeptide phosphotransferase/UDP-N-acetylglucosamine-1-phosphate transferase
MLTINMLETIYLSFYSFIVAFGITLLFIITQNFHKPFTADYKQGPQKIHTSEVTRIGGLAIIISYVSITFFLSNIISTLFTSFLISSFIAFLSGFLEDLTKKIRPLSRLLASIFTSIVFIFIMNITITRVGIQFIDIFFENYIFAVIFTIVSISLLTQATNIIDGLNGLAMGYTIISFAGIFLVCNEVDDYLLRSIIAIILGGIIGCFLFNFPKSLIFLGD